MKFSQKILHLETESNRIIKRALLYILMATGLSVLTYFIPVINPEANDTDILWLMIGLIYFMSIILLAIGFAYESLWKKGYTYKIRTVMFIQKDKEKEQL